MKILLDENIPKKLKHDLAEYEVYTVRDKGWNGRRNGELLQLMQDDDFVALLTFDKNLQHQQNFAKYPIAVLLLHARNNSYAELQHLIPSVKQTLQQPLKVGPIQIGIL
jgi:predicted nuclease of predicted toxin-antitoxin system